MREEGQRIIRQYLPGRREFLFKSSRARLWGDPIPPSQPADVRLKIIEVHDDTPEGQGFVCLTNSNDIAVDLTNWKLTGAGIEHHFRPGTVVPRGGSICVVGSVALFRRSLPAGRGSSPLFIQGNWIGKLDSAGVRVGLTDPQDRMVDTFELRR